MSQPPTPHAEQNWSGETPPDGVPSFAPPGSEASPYGSNGSYAGPGTSSYGPYGSSGGYREPPGPDASPSAPPEPFPTYQPGYRPADAAFTTPSYPSQGYTAPGRPGSSPGASQPSPLVPTYATNPYQTAPARARTGSQDTQLGMIGMAITLAATLLLILTVSITGVMANPPDAMGGLMLLAIFAGLAGFVMSIVAIATQRGRVQGVVGVVAGVAAWPVAFVVGVIVAVAAG